MTLQLIKGSSSLTHEIADVWGIFFSFKDNLKFVGHDINVTGVWERNITGKGVTVSVIDDGMLYLSDIFVFFSV